MMKKMLIFGAAFVFILILIITCSNGSIVEPPLGAVSGYVYEAGTTTPVESAKVYLGTAGDSTYSDEFGYYFLMAFPGSRTLHAYKDGYQEASSEIELIPDDTITRNFELQKE